MGANEICAPMLECVGLTGEEGKCECADYYSYNSDAGKCQRTSGYGGDCASEYDVCAQGLECDENKKCTKCATGYIFKDGNCIIEPNINTSSNSISDSKLVYEDESCYSKFVNFKIFIFFYFYILLIFKI